MGHSNKKITGTTFILVRSDKKILLQLRDNKSKYYPNSWCFPGESKEDNEDILDTAVRGINEEYGIQVSKNACHFITVNKIPHISQEIGVVICMVGSNQTPELREGKEMYWYCIEEVKNLKLGFEQNKFLPLVEKHLKFNDVKKCQQIK